MIPLRANRMLLLLLLMLSASSLFAVGCGGRDKGGQADPMALLRQGRCAEARSAALAQGIEREGNRALVALCHIAESPVDESAKKAISVLGSNAGDIRAAAAASEMLSLVSELPEPPDTTGSLLLAEAALGAVSCGPLAPSSTAPSITVGTASRDLALAVLHRVSEALLIPGAGIDDRRLLSIWNGCFSLDGGSFEAKGAYPAWQLYKSIATIALFVSRGKPESDFAKVLLGAAISVVEHNPGISVAVRCDLSSPFDDLKAAVAYDREILGRLERSVVNAAGCSRGTYAPSVP